MSRSLTIVTLAGALGMVPAVPAQQSDARPAVETLRIGSMGDPRSRFVAVPAVRAARNGEFVAVVRDSVGSAVVWFDSAGTPVWTRRFQPREGLSDVAVTGDTVAVLLGYGDDMRAALFRVGHGGAIAHIAVPARAGTRSSFLGWSESSLLVLRVTNSDTEGVRSVARVRPRHEVIRIEPRERVATVIWSRDDPAIHALTTTPAPVGVHVVGNALPWDVRMTFAVVPGGFCVSQSLEPELECVALRMDRPTVIPLPIEPRPLTPAQHERWLAEWRTRSRSLFSDSAFHIIAQLRAPATLPIVGALFGAPDGSIAIVRRDMRSSPFGETDSVRVDVMLRSGERRVSVVLPPGTQVQSFSGNTLFGTAVHASSIAARGGETGAPQPLVQIVRYHMSPF